MVNSSAAAADIKGTVGLFIVSLHASMHDNVLRSGGTVHRKLKPEISAVVVRARCEVEAYACRQKIWAHSSRTSVLRGTRCAGCRRFRSVMRRFAMARDREKWMVARSETNREWG